MAVCNVVYLRNYLRGMLDNEKALGASGRASSCGACTHGVGVQGKMNIVACCIHLEYRYALEGGGCVHGKPRAAQGEALSPERKEGNDG